MPRSEGATTTPPEGGGDGALPHALVDASGRIHARRLEVKGVAVQRGEDVVDDEGELEAAHARWLLARAAATATNGKGRLARLLVVVVARLVAGTTSTSAVAVATVVAVARHRLRPRIGRHPTRRVDGRRRH